MSSKEIIPAPPKGVKVLPDNGRYKNRFEVRSESSNRIYLVAYDMADAMRCWTCSCPGYIRHGKCKHTSGIGLYPVRSTRPTITEKPNQKKLK